MMSRDTARFQVRRCSTGGKLPRDASVAVPSGTKGRVTVRPSDPGSLAPGELRRGDRVLGRCVIERRLRRDRLATVYLARGTEPGEAFTVWCAHAAVISASESAVEAFEKFMARLQQLDHPGLPRVVVFGAPDGVPVVVCERHPGSTLREVIASGADRSPRFASRVLRGLAGILDALHGQDPPVLHRGIIPERVLLDEEGAVRLEEAGLLHALATSGFVSDRTVLSASAPGYLVPEEVAIPPSPRIDVFALAMVLFELLTGEVPFGHVPLMELSHALRRAPSPSVVQHRSDLPAAVDAVFDRAFGAARGEGYATVQRFARDLLRALDAAVSAEPEAGADLVDADPEPTPAFGNYSAMLAAFDARRSGAESRPAEREADDDRASPTPMPLIGSSKRTLPGGSFALRPEAFGAAPIAGAMLSEQDVQELSSSALQPLPDEAIDLSSRDLEPVARAAAMTTRTGRDEALAREAPVPTRRLKAPTLPPVGGPARSSLRVEPAPVHRAVTAAPPAPAPSAPPPPAVPGFAATYSAGAVAFAQAARLLAYSTVIAAICVTVGLLYVARAAEDLGASLRAAPSTVGPAAESPEPAPAPPPPTDAGVFAARADVVPAADVGAVVVDAAAPDRLVPADSGVAGSATDAGARDGGASAVPGPATVSRLWMALRAPVADCVEGIDAPMVTLALHFDGPTGVMSRVRLRGVFAEPPMGPCLEEAARRVRVAPFAAAGWDPSLTFPIAAAGWSQGRR